MRAILGLFAITFSALTASAITPQQYCELLKAKGTSYELLNTDYPATTVSTFTTSSGGGLEWKCPPDSYPPTSCSGKAVAVVLPPTTLSHAFSISTEVKKFCKDGQFLVRKTTSTKQLYGCNAPSPDGKSTMSVCPASTSSCEGNGCGVDG